MDIYKHTLIIESNGKGLYDFTAAVQHQITNWGVSEGLCHLFIQHTSASLIISESYDPTARQDLESYMDRIAPENQAWMRHLLEGADDSPSHMRAMLTHTDLTIPVDKGQLSLGRWQGIYLFEHRIKSHRRNVLLRFMGE